MADNFPDEFQMPRCCVTEQTLSPFSQVMAYCRRPWESKSKRKGPEYFRNALLHVSSKRSEEGKARLYPSEFHEFQLTQDFTERLW